MRLKPTLDRLNQLSKNLSQKFYCKSVHYKGVLKNCSGFLWSIYKLSPTFALHLKNNFSRVGGGMQTMNNE